MAMGTIGVIGSGSWATALVKVLQDNNHTIHWYVRSLEAQKHIQLKAHHLYLPKVHIDNQKVAVHDNVVDVCEQSDFILLATPSIFLEETILPLPASLMSERKVISAIKGLASAQKIPISYFLEQEYNIPQTRFSVLTGGSHAEEVAVEKTTYVSISSASRRYAEEIGQLFANDYFRCSVSTNIYSSEYVGIIKNIYAIAVGIAEGLGYGDNFMSALVAAALLEMREVLKVLVPMEKISDEYFQSCFAGDLLVTCYSRHSRNRRLGFLIGSSHSIALEGDTIYPEGYYAGSYIMNKLEKNTASRFFILSAVNQAISQPSRAAAIFNKNIATNLQ